MAEQKAYSSYIKDMPFLLLEMRKAAAVVLSTGVESVVVQSVEENIFQLDKELRRLKLAQRVALRLSVLDESLVKLIATGSEENAKLTAFYTILKTDLLFFEFMRDVYAEKRHIGQTQISDSEMVAFFECKAHESEVVAKWTSNNIVRVKNTYKRILTEAGLAKRAGNDLEITKPMADNEICNAFGKKDIYTEVMGLEVKG